MKSKLDFPDHPNINEEHTHSGVQWIWNGSGWVRQSATSNCGNSGSDDTTRIAKDIAEMIGIQPVKKGDVTVVKANGKTYKNINGSNGKPGCWREIGGAGASLPQLPDLIAVTDPTKPNTIIIDFSHSGVYPPLALTNLMKIAAEGMKVGTTQKLEIITPDGNPKIDEIKDIFDKDIFEHIPKMFKGLTYRLRLIAMPPTPPRIKPIIWVDLVNFYITKSATP